MPRTASYFIPSAMTGFIVSVFLFRNRVSSKEAFEGLELGEGKLSRPVLRGPGGRKAAWLLGSERDCSRTKSHSPGNRRVSRLFPVTIDGANRPNLSARGTLTLLNNALLSTHFRMADNSLRVSKDASRSNSIIPANCCHALLRSPVDSRRSF